MVFVILMHQLVTIHYDVYVLNGYTGHYCQSLLNSFNSCSQNPCGYNGTCLTTSNSSYYCICPNGLTGRSCNSSIFLYIIKKKF